MASKIGKETIEGVADEGLREPLLQLHATSIDELRNRVVHKYAYRPTAEEAEAVRNEAAKILYGLTARLRLRGDANWYISQPGW